MNAKILSYDERPDGMYYKIKCTDKESYFEHESLINKDLLIEYWKNQFFTNLYSDQHSDIQPWDMDNYEEYCQEQA